MQQKDEDMIRENGSGDGFPDLSDGVFNFRILFVDCIKGARKFWYVLPTLVLVCALITGIISKRGYVPMYSSSATFSMSSLNSNAYSYYYSYSVSNSMEKAFPYIISSPVMTNILKDELGVDYINGTYTAEATPSSNLFTITVKSNSSKDAFNILKAILNCYPKVADYVIGETQIEYITVPELNDKPYTSDSLLRDTVMGGAAGAAIWCMLTVLYALTRNTVRSVDDIENKLGQQCIAEIPFVKRRRNEQNDLLAVNRHLSLYYEAYRTLRTRLTAAAEETGSKIYAVTSALSGEGKSTVSFNLSYTLASAGKRVALVDLDLKRKTLQKLLYPEEQNLPGISDVAEGRVTLINAFKKYKHNNLHVYCAGAGEFFSVSKYRKVFDELRDLYDCIIVDCPPGGFVSDAVAVTQLCDGVLFTVRQDKATVRRIHDAMENLFFSRSQITGFVFNAVKADYKNYGGYYYGGYKYGSYRYGSYRYSSYRYGKYGYYSKYNKYGNYGYGGYGKGYGGDYGERYGAGYGYGIGKNDDDISADDSETD